jgi:hypothetical protein
MNQACTAASKHQVVGKNLNLERRAIRPAVNPAACVQFLRIAGQPIEPRKIGLSADIPDGQGEEMIGRIAILRHRGRIYGEESMRAEVEHPHRRGVALEHGAVPVVERLNRFGGIGSRGHSF